MATIPIPGSASAGAVAPSATANTWRDSAQWLLGSTVTTSGNKRPLAILRQTVAQNLTTSGTAADVLFDTEDADTDAGHSGSSATYTYQTAGTYLLIATAGFAANANGDRQAYFHGTINGVAKDYATEQVFAPTAGASACFVSTTAIVTGIVVGDTVGLRVVQNTGGALLMSTARDGSRLQVLWIGN